MQKLNDPWLLWQIALEDPTGSVHWVLVRLFRSYANYVRANISVRSSLRSCFTRFYDTTTTIHDHPFKTTRTIEFKLPSGIRNREDGGPSRIIIQNVSLRTIGLKISNYKLEWYNNDIMTSSIAHYSSYIESEHHRDDHFTLQKYVAAHETLAECTSTPVMIAGVTTYENIGFIADKSSFFDLLHQGGKLHDYFENACDLYEKYIREFITDIEFMENVYLFGKNK